MSISIKALCDEKDCNEYLELDCKNEDVFQWDWGKIHLHDEHYCDMHWKHYCIDNGVDPDTGKDN